VLVVSVAEASRQQAGERARKAEQVLSRFSATGRRITAARKLIVKTLCEGPEHASAEDLAERVQKLSPKVNRSTVYRTLEELEQLGILVHVHLGHGPATYHLAPMSHAHLVCESCGKAIEVPADLFASLSRKAARSYGFRLDPSHFALEGICRECREAAEHARKGLPDRHAPDQHAPDGSARDGR
jgi:Fur family ferric uptake transcriptional regulator